MVKKYTALFLMAILVIHLAGFYIYFIVRLGDLRMEMRGKLAVLPVEQLEVIRIPVLQFRGAWIDQREMKWGGNMYDIARTERAGNWIIVYCLRDNDEEGLLNFISAVIDMGSQDTRQAPSTVTQFFTLKFIVSGIIFPPRPVVTLAVSQASYKFHVMPVDLIPVTPPPRG